VDEVFDAEGAALMARVADVVAAPWESLAEPTLEALALQLWDWQRRHNPSLDRVARAFLGARAPRSWAEIPGVPTEVFKVARVACFAEGFDRRVFLTSGTTGEVRGRHPFADTAVYASGCVATAARLLLPRDRYRCVFVAEPEHEAPGSSLTFMLARFAERWDRAGSAAETFFVRQGVVDVAGVQRALAEAVADDVPVALLGTSFGFVHLLDGLQSAPALQVPEGSVAMLTGGFKGRAREVQPAAMAEGLRAAWGPGLEIVHEYGMTELSSQAYAPSRPEGGPSRYQAPPWMRLDVVDPDTLEVLPPGHVGLVRVLDLANVGSALVVQTSDLGRVHPDGGLELLGRAPGATPRGCARAMDALLSP